MLTQIHGQLEHVPSSRYVPDRYRYQSKTKLRIRIIFSWQELYQIRILGRFVVCLLRYKSTGTCGGKAENSRLRKNKIQIESILKAEFFGQKL